MVTHERVMSSLNETVYLPARLAFQNTPLVLRRLLVAPRGVHRGPCGGPIRTKHRKHSSFVKIVCEGTVIGSALGNLVHHCRGSKHSLRVVLSLLHRALDPVSDALRCSNGTDVPFLIKGMVCHRVLQAQGRHLRELKKAPPIDGRTGHVGVAVGACASVLVAFECMAASADPDGLASQLTLCLRDVQAALENWRVTDAVDYDTIHSVHAEMRAVERARAGVARAQFKAEVAGMSEKEAMRLQLLFYRRAAWPRGEAISRDTQSELVEKISSGELVDFAHPTEVFTLPTPGVLPLSGVAAAGQPLSLEGGGSGAGDGAAASGSASDEVSSLSGSSWGSFASSVESGSLSATPTPTSVAHPLLNPLAEGANQAVGRPWHIELGDVPLFL